MKAVGGKDYKVYSFYIQFNEFSGQIKLISFAIA